MTTVDVYEMWRLFNITLAVLCVVLNGTKVFGPIFRAMDEDERLGFLWAFGQTLAYCVSTAVYMALDGTPGPWTFVWTIPLLMGLYAGLSGRVKKSELKRR